MFYSTNIFTTATTSGKFIPSGQPRFDRGLPRFTSVQNREPPCEVGTQEYGVLSKRFWRSVEFIFGCFSTFAVIYNSNLKFFGVKIVKDAISN